MKLFAFLALACCVFAQEPTFRGLVLVADRDQMLPAQELQEFQGVRTIGVTPPGTLEELQAALEPAFANQVIEETQVQKIKQAVSQYYESKKQPFVLVVAPQQNLTDGVLQLVVMNATVGSVAAAPSVQKYVRSSPGDVVSADLVAQDLDLINRTPFRSAQVVYSPGKEPGTTDVNIVTEEKRPYRVYTGVENNGVAALQNTKVSTGFSIGNFLGIDQSFSFEYTSSADFSRMQGFKSTYEAPLPWRHLIKLKAGYSGTKTTAEPGITTTGSNYQTALRYTIPFSSLDWTRELGWIVDFKNTNSQQEFVSNIIIDKKDINIFQVGVESLFGLKREGYQLDLLGAILASPGPFLPRQESAEYDKLRPGATAAWVTAKTEAKYRYFLPMKASAYTRVLAQVSPFKLLPSEQLGLGGFETVRGYANRKENLDGSFVGNFELALPSFPVASLISGAPKDELQFLGFVDGGWGFENGSPMSSSKLMVSFGPALRYQMPPYISLKLDWGIRAYENGPTIDPGMLNFSAVASF